MPITYKGIDIIHMVKDGTNVRTKNIGHNGHSLNGAPWGAYSVGWWDKPRNFGITIGGLDLAHFYMPSYRDHYSSENGIAIPDGVNALKIFCIGGGGGGSGGNSGHRNTYRVRTGWNWRGAHYNYGDAWHNPSNGNIGAYGQYGQYSIGELNRNANTYNVEIGNGGHGGGGGGFRNGGIGNPGGSGGQGNATVANLGGATVVAGGGQGGYGTNDNRGGRSTTKPAYDPPGGLPGPPYRIQGCNAGNTSTGNGGGGGGGSRGFCRVYYLY